MLKQLLQHLHFVLDLVHIRRLEQFRPLEWRLCRRRIDPDARYGISNSFHIGKTSDTYAYSTYIGGGSKIIFGDTTASSVSNPFQMAGNYYADAGGGSCSTFSAAANHDINGYVVTAGGMTMGSGTYTINGYIAFGDNGGGSVSCNGTTVGMTGTGVTFIVTGATTPGSGTCKNMVLCFGAGFNYVALIAPTSGNFANALFIGPLTGSGISRAPCSRAAPARRCRAPSTSPPES